MSVQEEILTLIIVQHVLAVVLIIAIILTLDTFESGGIGALPAPAAEHQLQRGTENVQHGAGGVVEEVAGEVGTDDDEDLDDQETGQTREKRANGSGIAANVVGLVPVDFGAGGEVEGDVGGGHTGDGESSLVSIFPDGLFRNIDLRAENGDSGGRNANGLPLKLGRQPPGEEDDDDILEKEGDTPNQEHGNRQGGDMSIDMGHFGGNESEEDDGKAELANRSPSSIEIGPGVLGDEYGAIEPGVGDSTELHDEAGIQGVRMV